jgi:choice-of-anchor A domain-containing protein
VSGLQDVQGPVAAGGTVSLSSFNVNWNKALPIGLVSNGKLTLSNGTIHGTTYYGGDRSLNGATFDGSTISGRPIDFSTARVKLRAMSKMLQSYPGNGTVALSYSNLTLTGNNTNLNTFDSNAFTLGRAHSITLSVPAGSMVVINIDGQDVQFGNAGVVVNGLDQHNIIWNFPQAAKISMTSIGLPGSVLAPDADVSLTSGNINGTLVANSVTSTGEFHYVPFQYNMLPP